MAKTRRSSRRPARTPRKRSTARRSAPRPRAATASSGSSTRIESSSSTERSPIGPLLLAAGAVGLAWYAMRGSASAAALPGSVTNNVTGGQGGAGGTSGGGTSGGGTSGGGTSGGGTSGRGGTSGSTTRLPGGNNEMGQQAPLASTVSRIINDATFRDTYAFQSLMYSAGLTNAAPDGVVGPVTRGLMALAAQRTGTPVPAINRTTIQNLSRWMKTQFNAGSMTLRPQPTWLPYEAVFALDSRSIGSTDQGGLLNLSLVPIQTGYEPGNSNNSIMGAVFRR